jgi:hypothetical protein
MLRGPLHSEVELTLASKSDNDVYTIRVLRHRYHEFDSANDRASSSGIAQDVGGKPLQRAAGLGAKHVGDLSTSTSRDTRRPTAPLRGPEACFAGLEVTQQPPHAVVAVDDLVDPNFVPQGKPGYSNPVVRVGDRILAVSGRPAEHVPVQQLHGISHPCLTTRARAHTHAQIHAR